MQAKLPYPNPVSKYEWRLYSLNEQGKIAIDYSIDDTSIDCGHIDTQESSGDQENSE